MMNCCRPNAWLGIALATSSWARTSGTHVSFVNQSGLSFANLSLMDLNGGSCPGWPEALPAMESIQILSLYVNDFKYSAAFSLFWPHLNRHAPVVQKTV